MDVEDIELDNEKVLHRAKIEQKEIEKRRRFEEYRTRSQSSSNTKRSSRDVSSSKYMY